MGSSRTAILIVNGFDRVNHLGVFDPTDALRYPWLTLCLREVERRSRGEDYEVLVYDNSQYRAFRDHVSACGARLLPSDGELADALRGHPAHHTIAPELVLPHGLALDRLVDELDDDIDTVVTLDTDAFPVRDGWLTELNDRLDAAAITGVWRDEMQPILAPFVHVSCLAIRRSTLGTLTSSFGRSVAQDVGQNISCELLERGEAASPLRRSNVRQAHFLMAGVYGDLVYHHGAGSRRPVFRVTVGLEREEDVYRVLREAVFADADHLVDILRGEADDDLGLPWWPGPAAEAAGPAPVMADRRGRPVA